MFAYSVRRVADRIMVTAVLVIALFLLLSGKLSAQTEEEMVEDARVKMKLKDYDTAEAVLKEAIQKYPSSVDVAETLVTLYEETKNTEELIDACTRLIGILQLKEVKEKSLSSKETSLLKETEKKLAELVKIRTEADTAVEQFAKEAIEICRKLVSLKKYCEACYILQRLSALKVKQEEVKNLVQEMGKENSELIRRPDATAGADTEKAEKLLLEAHSLFKSGDLKEASISCKAALEVDPHLAAAVALLYDIEEKAGNTQECLTYGLTYLLFPPDAQSTSRAEEIEKGIAKASKDLKSFFDATRKCADEICKQARKAIREKKESDLEYVLEQITSLSHKTRKVEYILSEAASFCGVESKKFVQTGKLIASDDFSRQSNLWYQMDGYAYYEQGRFIVKSDLEVPFMPRYSRDFQPDDFYFESEIELIGEAKATTAGGLCFRVHSNDSYFAFMISPDGKFGAWLINRGAKKDLTGKEREVAPFTLTCCVPSKYIKRGKAKNTIAAAFVGSILCCYVNNRLVFTCEETTRLKGTLGFIANKGNNAYAFDNFKVYEAFLPKK